MLAGQSNNNLIDVNWQLAGSLAEINSKSLNQRQLFFHKNNFFIVIWSILCRPFSHKNELLMYIIPWTGFIIEHWTFCTRVYIHLGTLHSSINHFFKFKLTLARFYKVTVITYSANDLLFCYTLYKCSFQWFLHGHKFFYARQINRINLSVQIF